MPSSPELPSIFGHKWQSEILRQGHTKYLCSSYYNVHASGKLHVKLNGVADCSHYNHKTTVCPVIVVNLAYKDVQTICYYHLLQKTPGYPHDSAL